MAKKDSGDPWRALLDERRRRVGHAHAMGGAEKLRKRKAAGKRNAREWVELLCDQGSFLELGTLAGSLEHHGLPPAPADALVAGMARIDGQEVLLGVEDFTVQGGSIGPATNAKRVRLARLAAQELCPLVMLLDGAGERSSNALQRYSYAPNDMQEMARLSGLVPTVALVIGSSAGHGAVTALLMDFVLMLQGATMFSAGPPVVETALGEVVSKEALGGAAMHTGLSGVAHNLAADEEAAARCVGDYLGYLPRSAWEYPPSRPAPQEPAHDAEEILRLIPSDIQQPYDVKAVIALLMDPHSVFEIQPHYGTATVSAFARLGGHSVAVLANQPAVMAGSIDRQAAEKAARFLRLANAFHVPILFLADNPGIMSGKRAEQEGTLRAAARMYAAQTGAQVPKLHVTLRKAFGFGSSSMAMNPFDAQTITLALPGISLGGLPASGGAKVIQADEQKQQQMAAAEEQSAWRSADTLAYDEIVDPRELRGTLLQALELCLNRRRRPAQPVQRMGIDP